MSDSSNSFAAAFILKPKPSRWLCVWWLTLHVVLAAVVYELCRVWPPAVLGLPVIVAHAALRWPRLELELRIDERRCWSLPGHSRLMLAQGTAYTTLWARLVLQGDNGRVVRLLLIKDQLAASDWRRLQALLRG